MAIQYQFETNSDVKQAQIVALLFFVKRFGEKLVTEGLDPLDWWWSPKEPLDTLHGCYLLNHTKMSWSKYQTLVDEVTSEFKACYTSLADKAFNSDKENEVFKAYRTHTWVKAKRKKYFQANKIVSATQLKAMLTKNQPSESEKVFKTWGIPLNRFKDLLHDIEERHPEGCMLVNMQLLPRVLSDFETTIDKITEYDLKMVLTAQPFDLKIPVPGLNIDLTSDNPTALSRTMREVIEEQITSLRVQIETELFKHYQQHIALRIDKDELPRDVIESLLTKVSVVHGDFGSAKILKFLRRYRDVKRGKTSTEQALTADDQMLRTVGKVKHLNETSS